VFPDLKCVLVMKVLKLGCGGRVYIDGMYVIII
jgi:hypothetical protein